MSAYVLFHFDVTNPDVFQAHGKSVVQSAQEYKGEFLIPPTEAESLEGKPPRSMNVILRFDSEEAARQWYNSETYQQGKKVRDGELNMLITLLA